MNYASSGTITAPNRTVLGVLVTGPNAGAPARYLMALGFVVVFALVAKNLVRGRIGRSWMAIRDRDIAAEIIGVRPLRTKLLAFGISSFYCGVAGAELVFLFLGSAETLAFDINQSFLVLFMIIIGGLGSILGSFLGAGFIILVPILLTNMPHWVGIKMSVALQKEIELMAFGGLIIFFLIVEPHGLGATLADHQGEAAPVALPVLRIVLTPPPENWVRWKWRRGAAALGRRAVRRSGPVVRCGVTRDRERPVAPDRQQHRGHLRPCDPRAQGGVAQRARGRDRRAPRRQRRGQEHDAQGRSPGCSARSGVR